MILRAPAIHSLLQHLERHWAENGQGGFYFAAPASLLSVLQGYDVSAWCVLPPAERWQRVWGWLDDTGVLRAHCVVTGNPHATHRCTLAMGVEAPWRRQGHGRALMAEALAWVCDRPELAWVDGWAFAHNEPVLRLDREMGFEEVGRVVDVVRVQGQSLEQVLLAIDLRRGGVPWHSEQHS
jgi:GNAT superfamily N-acetyltransferase